ncbi:hypothetical protein BDD12DRAFT_876467 [Trichophaea hybrida]|nr:hypothetical protein BDD12DRAFT_876467 [Trichophaea hybrida]
MRPKKQSKKGKGVQASSSFFAPSREKAETETVAKDSYPVPSASFSAASPKPATVTERPVTPEGYATQGQQRLAFGERKYDSDDGSALSEPKSEYEYNSDDFMEGDSIPTDAFSLVQALREEFETSLHSVEAKLLAKLDVIPRKVGESQRQNEKTMIEMEMKLRSAEKILIKNVCDISSLQAQVEKLENENRELKTSVEEQLAEGKKAKEEQKATPAAAQIVTPPTTPRKEIAIRSAPPDTPTRVVTPLAQQVLKRNMAKRKEQSGSEVMDVDHDNDNNDPAPIIGRP